MRDRDVRIALRKSVLAAHLNDPDTQVVEEMGVWSGTVRIDVAVLNGELCGYEIKSDRDTLDRLPYQVEIYSKVFDRLTLVVGSKHAEKAAQIVPKWWGITIAREKGGMVTLHKRRSAKKNRSLDMQVLCEQLLKVEALQLLSRYDTAKGWATKGRRAVFHRVLEVVPHQRLVDEVREILKRRQRDSRQQVPNQLDVPIHSKVDPFFQVTLPTARCSN